MAKEKKVKEAQWQELPWSRYREVMPELLHFSWKTVNSNISPGGVRLGPEAGLAMPYVSARSVLARKQALALDYQKNVGNTATVVKQIHMAQRGEAPPQEGAAIVQALAEIQAQGAAFGLEVVSPRMRQLLLPRQPHGAGDYVALSPVGCGGLNSLLNQAVAAHNQSVSDAPKQRQRLRQAHLPFGGANPQNVGSQVRAMQSPLFFAPPQEHPELRKALALHFQGAQPQLPPRLMWQWFEWFNATKQAHQGAIPSDSATREQEQRWAQQVAQAVLAQGAAHRACLQRWRARLPLVDGESEPSLLAPGVDVRIRGWIEPEQRFARWPHEFAEWLSRLVSEHRFGQEQHQFSLQYGAHAISKAMLEVLR